MTKRDRSRSWRRSTFAGAARRGPLRITFGALLALAALRSGSARAAPSTAAPSTAAPAASSQEADFRRRIEETRQRLAAEATLPEEQRWEVEEKHLRELEDRSAEGDTRSAQFLVLAQERMAKLRRARFEKAWGRMLNHPDATVELKAHALRAAELRRLRVLAHARKYPALEQRALELLGAEWERHQKQMQAIADDLRRPATGDSKPGAPASSGLSGSTP